LTKDQWEKHKEAAASYADLKSEIKGFNDDAYKVYKGTKPAFSAYEKLLVKFQAWYGETSFEVESDNQTLLLTTAVDVQALLLSDEELIEESKDDVFEAGNEMDEDIHNTDEEETQSPEPNKDQPESSHAQETKSDSDSPCPEALKKYDNGTIKKSSEETHGSTLDFLGKELPDSVLAIKELETLFKNLEEDLDIQAHEFEAYMEDLIRAKVEQEQRAIRAEYSLRKQFDECNANFEKLKAENQNLDGKIHDLENKTNVIKTELSELRNVNKDKDTEVERLQSEIERLKTRCNDMKQFFKKYELEKENLKKEVS
nr:hypothetical protein [Tanacetum cinerariifolium]